MNEYRSSALASVNEAEVLNKSETLEVLNLASNILRIFPNCT